MNKKKPSGPILTPTLLKAIAEAASEKAIEAYRKEVEVHREEARDRRFHNTKLLLERFKGLEEHSKEAVRSASQVEDDPDLEELVELMKGYDNRYEASVPSIMKSAAYTSTLVHHVKRMLDFYKRCCDVSQKPEDSRRYRIIYSTYLAEPGRPEELPGHRPGRKRGHQHHLQGPQAGPPAVERPVLRLL